MSLEVAIIIEQGRNHVLQVTGGEVRVTDQGGQSLFPVYGSSGGLSTSTVCYLEATEFPHPRLAEINFGLEETEHSVRSKISQGILDAQENLLRLRGHDVPSGRMLRRRPVGASIPDAELPGLPQPQAVSSRPTRIPIQLQSQVFQAEEIERAVQFLRENPDFFSSRNQNKVKGRRIKLEKSD